MRKFILSLMITVISVMSVMAQRTITGKVSAVEEPEGIPGVNIKIKDSSIGTVTNLEGEYSLVVPDDTQFLIFSFVGFKSKEVALTNSSTLNVVLDLDVKLLNEVVIVGYGTQERREITGSVASIKSEAIENLMSPSFESQFAGRAPGVQVTTPSGVLGQRPIIRIRGVNSISSNANPLIVIDGVPVLDSDRSAIVDSNPLANINPADISSYEVLKDGSASAIYGSRAANGVILITTKRGSTGKAKVSYNTSLGVNKEINRFELLTGDQFVSIANEKRTNAGQSPLAVLGTNTDWQDMVFRAGFTQQHNLSISGGSDATKYFFSLGFTDQESSIISNDLSRYSFRANLNHSVSNRVRLGTSLSYSFTEIVGLNVGPGFLSGVIYNATRSLPNVPIYDSENIAFDGFNVTPNGSTTGFGNNLAGPDNNISNIGFVIQNNEYRNRVHRMMGNAFAEVDLLQGLTAKTQIGVDITLANDFRSLDPRHGDGRGSNGDVYMGYSPASRWNWQNTLNYQTVFANDHSLNITAGLEYQFSKFYNFFGQGSDLSDSFYRKNNLISGSFNDQFTGGGYTERGFDSYFGRFNYSYQGKYLASFTLRNDGISDLAAGNKRGTFYGGSIGWRLSAENFFNSDLISDLKMRASFAEVGNTEIGSFAAFGGYSPVLGGAGAGIGYDRIANNQLQWETSRKLNIGLDMNIGAVTISADYFKNNINGLILEAPTIPSLGVPKNKINQNVGSMTNSGLELRVMSKVLENESFSWNTDFNITFISNKVNSLVQPLSSAYNRTVEGKSIAQLYGYQWAGVNTANGNPMYYSGEGIVQFNLEQDIDGKNQKTWRAYDPENPANISVLGDFPTRDFLGNTLPKWQGGWSNSFKFGQFDAEIFTRFSGGNYIMNESLRGLLGQGFSNNHVSILNRWTESGQVTDIPKLFTATDQDMWQNSASNSRFIEKGDFVRIQNIIVGYTLPAELLASAFDGMITNARFFAQVQNPFLFTGYSGLDPEANQYSSQLQFGVDYNVAPIVRTYSVGLNVGF